MLGCLKSRKRGTATKRRHASSAAAKGRDATLDQFYKLLHQIGEGKTAQVFVAKSFASGHEVAVKLVQTEYLNTASRQQALEAELAILAELKHKSIVQLLDVFHEREYVAIVTQKAGGRELLETVALRSPEQPPLRQPWSEREVAFVVRELLAALTYMHSRGITHRDVKVENILCKSPDDIRAGVLLIDFGLAHQASKSRRKSDRGVEMTGMNGTCHYMAPEMFGRDSRYGSEIDLWALGVVTYILLFGCFPFDARFLSQVEDKILAGAYSFPDELSAQVSHHAKKFLQYLLVVNPSERPPAAMALQHPWLQEETHVNAQPFSDLHMRRIRSFLDGKKSFSSPPPP